MTTLQELVYYCNEPEPVGALMLTGEWGCGKTYLLENVLKDELATTHIILRISLFGISSIEAIDESVHNAWLKAYLEDKGCKDKSETLSNLKEKLSRLPLPDNWKNIVSFNPAILMNTDRKLNGKEVVLVFDDLERSKLDTIDVMGCINEYTENQKFHTIVVANEDKIPNKQNEDNSEKNSKENVDNKNQQLNVRVECVYSSQKSEISYDEIKEKIIERTIKYKPDYAGIVHAVIENQKSLSDQYHDFLVKHEKNILELFGFEPDKLTDDFKTLFLESKYIVEHPHNIRSLKCALQDFYRIYSILTKESFSDLDKWLYSFVCYMLSYKAGIAKEGKYGTLFTDEDVRLLYPAFNNRYLFKAAKNWILKGEWDDKLLKAEIQEIKDREKAIEPKDIVRTYQIMDIDEDILVQGYSEAVEMAYGGMLSLNEYVHFIYNCYWAREYKVELPCKIEWSKVKEGVQLCIKKLLEENAEDSHIRSSINQKDKHLFLKEEWETYELIENFWNDDVLMFEQNKKMYLDNISQNPSQAFMKCENKRMDVFDEDMAKATAEAFLKSSNCEKRQFSEFFKSMWQNIKYRQDIRVKDTVQGFEKLLSLLEHARKSFQEENRMIATKHTDDFMATIKALIEENTPNL